MQGGEEKKIEPVSSKRIFIVNILAIFLMVVLIVTILFNIEKNKEQDKVAKDEFNLLEMLSQGVKKELEIAISDLRSLKHYAEDEQFLTNNDDSKMEHFSEDLESMAHVKNNFKGFIVANVSGQELLHISANPTWERQEKRINSFYNLGSDGFIAKIFKADVDSIYVSDVSLRRLNGKIVEPLDPIVQIGMPILNEDKEKIGAIVAVYSFQGLFSALRNKESHYSEQVDIFNQEGYWILSSDHKNEWGFEYAEEKDKTVKNQNPALWQEISSNDRGHVMLNANSYFFQKFAPQIEIPQVEHGNLESQPRIALSDITWYMVAEVAAQKIHQSSYVLLRDMTFLGSIMFLVMLIISLFTLKAITKNQKAEARIIQLNEILQILNKILRHDLSGKFTAIRLSLDNYLVGKKKVYLDAIKESTMNGIDLIGQMKRLETLANSGEEGLTKMRISDVLKKITNEYKIQIEIAGDGVIWADAALNSVFDNIIRNAIMHGQTAKIDIKILEEGKDVVVKFVDYGKGMPAEIHEKIFEEGFKYGETGHTGLGLYIVKKTIERYGGTIKASSNTPQGAIFTLKLRKAV